jgi:hypothetical protein
MFLSTINILRTYDTDASEFQGEEMFILRHIAPDLSSDTELQGVSYR